MKQLSKLLIVVFLLQVAFTACKAKRCASFEGQDGDRKLKYDRNGRVKR